MDNRAISRKAMEAAIDAAARHERAAEGRPEPLPAGFTRGLSHLATAMIEDIAAATSSLHALIDRAASRGHVDASAIALAHQHVTEAEMWSRRALVNL